MLINAASLVAAQAIPTGQSFFAEQLYPLMQRVQCNLCHNDNGVASETDLEFPSIHADQEQVVAFGLKLMDYVDRDDPEQSLLFLKPTNREEHTGGERIKPGSQEEQLLLTWIRYLAKMTDEQESQARKQIDLAERHAVEPLMIRRLTHSQYNHTVRDLLGDATRPATRFPQEDYVRGFKNQVETQGVSPLQAEAYAQAAERLASRAVRRGPIRELIPDERDPAQGQAVEDFVRKFGRNAFRRPMTADELEAYVTLFQQEVDQKGVEHGARIVVEAMLQSPHFLFRVQQGKRGAFRQYEIASRLSYFLWDTMPSAEMFDGAERGEFSTLEQIESAARRMLSDPRAKGALEEFLAQWMRFDRVATATRDRRRYSEFSSEIAAAMVEETRALFNHLVWEDKNFMEFFTADYTFLNADLASLYKLPVPEEEFARVKYPPDSGRSGVLGHGAFLVATSKPAETSPTERGLFIRNHFLGHEVPPPPPGVNTALPNITEDKPMTNRERLQVHLNSAACAGCHRLIDPIGFGFEQYDAIGSYHEKISMQFGSGRYRDDEATTIELELDTSAYVQGIDASNFDTPKQLGQILAKNEACQRCIVKQLFRYAFGRQETAGDRPQIDAMLEKFRSSGFRFRELVIALVTSDLFLGENGDRGNDGLVRSE